MSLIITRKPEESSKIETILTAAQKRFGHYGLCKTTMNEIAEDIGISKASLYYYYADKEELFEAVIVKEQEQFVRDIRKIIDPTANASELLQRYVKKRRAYFEKYINLGKLKFDAALSSNPCIGKMNEVFREKEAVLIMEIIEIGIVNKEFKEVDVKEVSDFLLLLMKGLRIIVIKQKNGFFLEKEDHDELQKNLEQVVKMFIRYIQP
jgi:TetR/AcrR family transcriptional regulator